MIREIFILMIGILLINILFSLYGISKVPSSAERVVGANLIGTKVVAIMILIAFLRKEEFILDVALTYTLLGYIATLCVAKYLELREER